MNKTYIGNPLQLRGAEQYTLNGAKGEGMKFLYIRNGLGLELWLSLDRAADVSRVNFNGKNIGYFSPCGYVHPQYYDKDGAGFLKSFTAGFFTTCGLTAVGSPCTDDGEELPLHGTISNTPAELLAVLENENELTVLARVRDCTIFGRKLVLMREYKVSYTENKFTVNDKVTNEADTVSPYMIMYHCNFGYPLLNENTEVVIPNNSVEPRNDHANEFIASALKMEEPQAQYEECCYYYDVKEHGDIAKVGLFSGSIDTGVVMSYNKTQLPRFVEWKMMGKTDYVLGLEPANCTPDGRNVLRENGTLKFLQPNESGETSVTFEFVSDYKKFKGEF